MPPGESSSVLNSCMTVPVAISPAYILSVTSSPFASAWPLKDGVWLLVTPRLSGLSITTLGGAASAVQTWHGATATSDPTAARKSVIPALLMWWWYPRPCHASCVTDHHHMSRAGITLLRAAV